MDAEFYSSPPPKKKNCGLNRVLYFGLAGDKIDKLDHGYSNFLWESGDET